MVPEPTRPRGPIAAMYSSPGPCYQLRSVVGAEDHCNSKRKLPSYSIAGRGKQFTDDCSPGPKYNPDGMTNKGKAGAPQPSISGRHADMQQWMTPSPDKYGVDGATKQVYRNAPQYSIGGRTKQSKSDNTPSPNAYSLPTTVGANCVDKSSAPSYGVRSRPNQGGFSEDLQKTPGPGAYKTPAPNVMKKRAPAYHLIGKYPVTFKAGEMTPGPANYNNEVTATRKAAPAFSFGIRHSEYTAPLIAEPTDMD
ncbi:ciliary microtubule associated protein 1A-like isoform X2 [Symsagittifera roscoffensis]|uniref:ciliary microtubule associated protein 1A-like isoform X2 n=1 Tax=Symsagittifera roscoffensis TaxID=84072 RepID=UPI00307CC2D1